MGLGRSLESCSWAVAGTIHWGQQQLDHHSGPLSLERLLSISKSHCTDLRELPLWY